MKYKKYAIGLPLEKVTNQDLEIGTTEHNYC